jgi:urease accessory protein
MSAAARPAPIHQRASGRAELRLGPGPQGARILHLDQVAPLRLLFPEADPGDPSLAAIVNVGGGLAGGDRVDVAVALDKGARATITTPAAEKIYRSLGDATEIAARMDLAEGAVCEWLPQETILFDGARLSRRLRIVLHPGARLLAAEMLVFGRAARGESFLRGAVHDRWRITRGGRLLWADALRLDDPAALIPTRFALGGAGAVATLLLAAPDAAAHRDAAREAAQGAASLVAPGLLVARWAGEAGAVRAGIGAAIMRLRSEALDHPPRLPRLWRT